MWAGGAALALALLGCGSITPLDGADGGLVPPRVTVPDAGIISVLSADAGSPPPAAQDAGSPPPAAQDAGSPPPAAKDAGSPPPAAKDAGPPPPKAKDAGPPPMTGCTGKGGCSGGLVCNAATGLCVECLVDDDCKGKTKLCDLSTLTCVGCGPGDDCDGDHA
ncbi:MAG TPA: hypothetical protein VHO06_07240 [Polyangia bacterium]|nr:hypothetical protein [Polyangia bacterium]